MLIVRCGSNRTGFTLQRVAVYAEIFAAYEGAARHTDAFIGAPAANESAARVASLERHARYAVAWLLPAASITVCACNADHGIGPVCTATETSLPASAGCCQDDISFLKEHVEPVFEELQR